MRWLNRMSHSLPALLLCLVAGSMAGVYAPKLGELAHVLGQVYLAIVSMATIPLLVVATFFGLRQTMALPMPGRRLAMIIGLAVLLVLTSAAAGLLTGWLVSPGAGLDTGARAHLGALVQQSGDSEDTEMLLWAPSAASVQDHRPWAAVIPDNVFKALAEGRSLGILSCAILFGLGFAALAREQGHTLNQLLEGAYRALELIISKANVLLPVVAFGIAAHVFAGIDFLTLQAMASFLLHFAVVTVVLCALAIAVVCQRSAQPLGHVLQQLKTPMLVSLVSSSTTASIPHAIEAMSARLGFSRGIVELVIPTASVFLRAGSSLYYVLLTLFVANLYDRSLSVMDLGMLCAGATLAAFASAGNNSLTNVGFAAMTLAMLQLPLEAALALFLAIDLMCEGLRNLLTLLASCALVALVSAGLPSERSDSVTTSGIAAIHVPVPPTRLVLTSAHAVLLVVGSVIAAALIVLMGVGIGARSHATGGTAVPSAPTTSRVVR